MAKLETVVKSVRHDFTKTELSEIADQQTKKYFELEDLKSEAKNTASQYANRLKTLEGSLKQVVHKHSSKYELRDTLCYIRKNYETKEKEYINVDTGEVVYKEPFMPSDYRKQLDLKEEEAKQKLSNVKFYGMKFFFDSLQPMLDDEENADKTIQEIVNEKRAKLISLCIGHIVNDKKLMALDGSLEFDIFYEMVEEWYIEFVEKNCAEPTLTEYPVLEIVQEQSESQPTPNEGKPKAEKKPKGFKKKDEQKAEDIVNNGSNEETKEGGEDEKEENDDNPWKEN